MNSDHMIAFSWTALTPDLEVDGKNIRSSSSLNGFKTAIGEFVLRPFNKVT